MCYTYDKSKGGDTRELQSRMVAPPKNWVESPSKAHVCLTLGRGHDFVTSSVRNLKLRDTTSS